METWSSRANVLMRRYASLTLAGACTLSLFLSLTHASCGIQNMPRNGHVSAHEMVDAYKPREGASEQNLTCNRLALGLPASRKVRKKFLLFKPPSVGILL